MQTLDKNVFGLAADLNPKPSCVEANHRTTTPPHTTYLLLLKILLVNHLHDRLIKKV